MLAGVSGSSEWRPGTAPAPRNDHVLSRLPKSPVGIHTSRRGEPVGSKGSVVGVDVLGVAGPRATSVSDGELDLSVWCALAMADLCAADTSSGGGSACVCVCESGDGGSQLDRRALVFGPAIEARWLLILLLLLLSLLPPLMFELLVP